MAANSGDRRAPRRPAWLLPLLAVLVIGIVVAGVWLATPLRQYLTVEDFVEAADALEHMRFAPLIVLGVYVFGTFLFVPLTLTVAATGAVFGAWPGLAYAFVGTMSAAAASYGVGALLGGRKLRRLAGPRVDDLSRKVARRGVRAVLAVRLVPIAPFIVVNLVAGASAIRLRDYLIGTAMGVTPGILIKVVFVDQFAQAAEASDETSMIRTAVLGVLALLAAGWLARVARRRWGGRGQDEE